MVRAVAVREAKRALGVKGNSLRDVKIQLEKDRTRLSCVEDELESLRDRIGELEWEQENLENQIEAAELIQAAEGDAEEEEPIRTHSAIRPKSERSLSCFES